MNEQAINDLYNLAKQNGYTKSLDEFVNLMYTNDNAFNDMYSLAQSNGYQKSQDDFSVLIGKKKSESQPQPTAQAQPMAQKPQAPDAMASSSGAPSSALPSTKVRVEEFKGFDEETLKRMKASATEAPQMALMRHEKKAEKQREEDRAQVLAEIETWKDYKEQPYFEGELGNTIRSIPFGIGGFIDDMGRAYGAGATQADIASPSNSLMISGPSSSPEQIKKYVEAAKALNKYGPSDEMVAFTKAIEEDNGGAWGFIKGLIQNPSVIPEVMLSSTRALFNSASGATAGTVVGGAAAGGAAFGGVGAGPAALASIPYAMGAAGATLETASSFAEFMNEELQKRGLELSEENVKTILEDENALSSMRNRALTRGVTIGVIDAFTGRVAGRVGAKIGKGAGTAAKVKAGLASSGIEAVGGAGGEATARALVGQEMDIAEIGLEGVGEMPMATIDVAAEVLRSPRYKINGEVRSAEDVKNIINTASAEELQKINFDIRNDRNGFNQQIQDKIVTNQVRNEIKDASPDIDDESLNQLTTLEMELRKVEGNKTQTGRDKANQIRSQIREVQQAAAEKKAAAIVETAPAETKPTPITAEQVALKEEEAAIAANILRAEILDDIFKDSTAQNKADALEQRMNNAEEIPMTEINDVLDGLYKQVEMVMDNYFDNEVGKQYAQVLLDKIDKIKSYEFATDKETAVITERTAVQTARNTVQETASVINLARAPRRKATITSEDGTTGTYSIEVGPDGAVTFEQPDAEPIRVGNVNDVNKTAKIVETVLNEKGLPQSVSFSITDEQGKSHTIKVEAKANLKPQQLLDLAINIRANELGTVDPTDFDTAYQEVTKEVTTTKLVSDAIQKQTAGQVPVQPTARPSEEVAQGEPQAEPQVTAQAGVQEEVSRLEQAFGGAFAPTPSGGVSAQTQKPSGISVSNREQVSELETKTTDTNKKKIIKAATTAINTLKSIFPDMDIVIHDNEGSYDSQMGQVNGRTGSAGNFAVTRTADGKIVGGRIDINLSKANMRTVAHEVAHAVMLKAFGDNPALFKVFRDRITNILSETRIKSLNDFVSQYAENDSHEEFLVELSAALGEAQEQLKPITVNKITQLINKVVSKITGGKVQPFSGIVQTNELIDFMNTMSSAIGRGEAIQVKEGETKGAAGVVSKAQVEGIVPKTRAEVEAALSRGDRVIGSLEMDDEPMDINSMEMVDRVDLNTMLIIPATTISKAQKKEITKFAKDEKGKIRPEQGGDRAGRYSSGSLAPLAGAPNFQGARGPDPELVAIAEKYAQENGIDLKRQAEYVSVDEDRAKRIADAYEKMEHNPNDPKVREAYADLIAQTKKQYQALADAGYVFSFFDSKTDPYNGNPVDAMRDLRNNKRMAVYGTYDGYGTEGITKQERESNPMLEDTGLRWKDQNGIEHPVTANDLFRAVHDAFGHGLEGAGFRARGEENAWQAHVRLFTGPAVAAITTETRGQNSWLNYGPFGEKNRNAKLEDTVFADNKIGLMPEWTWTEGRAADMPTTTVSKAQVATEVKEMGETFTVSKAQVDAYHGSPYDFDRFTTEKIGTGEGAQAFGWGLYFTDLKNIAERYANKLAKTTFMGKAFDENPMLEKLRIGLDDEHSNFYNQYSGRITNISEFKDYLDDQYEYLLGESQKPIDENHPMVKRMMSDNDYSKQKIDNARNTIAKFKSPEFKEKVKKLNEVVTDEGLKKVFLEDFIKSEKFAISFLYEAMKYWSSRADRLSRTINFVKNDIKRDLNYFKYLKDNIDKFQLSKKLYQVSLHQGKTPDQYTWLEWDKPVSKNLFDKIAKQLEIDDKTRKKGERIGTFNEFSARWKDSENRYTAYKDYKNGEVYEQLAKVFGAKDASLLLLRAGIDGVKYPAESIARGATSDTARGFNYVVFDENAVTIVSKAQKADQEVRKVVKKARAEGYSEAGIKAFLVKKGFTAQEADALMSKPEAAKKVTMTENNLLKIKIKEYARGAKDTKTAIANATKELTDMLAEMVNGGKISSAQLRTIIKKFGSLKVLNEKSLNRFFDYMTKVIADADYSSKLENAQSLRKAIKKLSRNKEKNASMRELAKRFVDIDPSLVDDIDAYNDIAQKIKESVKGSTIREGKITQAEMVNIEDSNEYISETMDAQRQKLFDEKAAEIQELLGVDVSDLSYEQLLEMVDKKEKITKYNEGLVRSAIIRMFGTYSSIIEQMFSTSKDPFTGEDIDIDPKKKELVQRFMDMDLNQLTAKQGLEAVDALTNFIQNGSTAKMEAVVSEYTGEKNAMELEEKGIKSEPLKAYFSKGVGRFFAEQFMSLPVMLERMFKGIKRASLFEKMSGLIDLRNKKSDADRKVTDIINDYVDKFYKEKANGEDFNTSYNATERGLVAFMTRNVVGTAKQMAEEFSRRKALIEESIEVLSKGTDAEKAKAELYQKAYDKLLKDSKDGDEVRSKADKKNLEAIDYWKNKWAEIYDDLSDVSENVYNTLLDKDSNYTPDRFTRLDSAGERTPLENDQSMFHGNTNIIYKKKTGVLMEAERPKQLPRFEGKKKAGMYVDLSFDRNNANSMYDALVDINTAATIRQVEAFINSESFDSIIDNPKDAKLLKGRIQQFVRNMRDKNIVESDELSKAARSLNVMATIGVGQALGGIFQPFKQTIPVIVNTMINAGKINMSIPFNTAVNDFLNKSGYAIANRGLASTTELSSIEKLAELAESSKGEKLVKAIEAANKKMLEILLVKADVAVARASWIAYYEKSLQEQGIDTKSIDYSTHELNKEAADYAQRMVDRQQNISDHDLAGKMFTSKAPMNQIFVKAVMPFASFRINQWMRMTTDLSVLKSKTASKQDKRIAARSLAGFTAEMLTFKLISFGIIVLMGTLTKALMGHDEDEEEEKKRIESAKKGQLTSTITDVFSPLPFLDKPVQAGAGWLLNKVQDIMGVAEEEKTTIFEPKKSDFISSLGSFGISTERIMQIVDLVGLSINGKFKDDYGNEKQLSEEDMDVLKNMLGLAVLSTVGLAPAEVNTIVRNSIKFAKKNAKTEKQVQAEKFSPPNGLTKEQFKRYFPEEYEEMYGEGSTYYKMTQPERERKKKIDKKKQKLMDEYYNYQKKSKKDSFGSDGFGEEKQKKDTFGSQGFGEED